MLIGLTGWKRSGKTSVGTILEEQYGFTQLYFAEPVYQAVWELNPFICTNFREPTFQRLQDVVEAKGWESAKEDYPEVRRLLQMTGTEIGRNIINVDVWVRILDSKMKELPANTDVVITDVRFPNEDWYVHNNGGTLWRIVRSGTGLNDNHTSELGQKDLQSDYTVNNNGDMATLYERVAKALEWEKSKL